MNTQTKQTPPSVPARFPHVPLDPHTVYILCGPAYCGKSTFAKALSYAMEVQNLSFEVLSSDQIRLEILYKSRLSPITPVAIRSAPLGFSRTSEAMAAVSESAFRILEAKLEAMMKFPVITEALIVDTTAASESFRDKIRGLCEKYHYKSCLITFEYRKNADYYPDGVTAEDRVIIDNSLSHFKRKVLPTIRAKDYHERVRIKDKLPIDESDGASLEDLIDEWLYPNRKGTPIELALTLRDTCSDLAAPTDKATSYAVIGDSHECTAELRELVGHILTVKPGAKIVHVGDYLDKGGDTRGMVAYMHERMKCGDIILHGNHESYVYKRLKGKLEQIAEELEKEYFSSVTTFLADPELTAKFFEIFEKSVPLAVLCDYSHTGGVPVYVTHAPCDVKYLGKFDEASLREQRNYRTQDRTKPFHEELEWLYDQAEFNHPLHIFGHVAHTGGKYLNYKNKVFLDTGAVYGGELSAVIVEGGKIVDRLSVKCRARCDKPLSENLAMRKKAAKEFDIADYDLSAHELRLISHVEKNQISYISGTMAPAPSRGEDIESLEAGLEQFSKRGVNDVVLQPKFMGSRGQLYLKKGDPAATKFTSRSGWVVKKMDGLDEDKFDKFKVELHATYSSLLDAWDEVILDGEILPWGALGRDLIEREFHRYSGAISLELGILGVALDPAVRPELAEFAAKMNVGEKQENLAKFDAQLDIFAKAGTPSFAPFDVLWAKNGGGNELAALVDNHVAYSLLASVSGNPLKSMSLDLTSPTALAETTDYFNALVKVSRMEGVVIKPRSKAYGKGQLPYMKVRNKEYLRLVYGFDYTSSDVYSRLCSQKNITGKVRLSIQEHELAMKMLANRDVPDASLDINKPLVVQMIGSMNQEKALDPRL